MLCFYTEVKNWFISWFCLLRFFFKSVYRYRSETIVGRKEEYNNMTSSYSLVYYSLSFLFRNLIVCAIYTVVYFLFFSIIKMAVLLRILCIILRAVFLSYTVAIIFIDTAERFTIPRWIPVSKCVFFFLHFSSFILLSHVDDIFFYFLLRSQCIWYVSFSLGMIQVCYYFLWYWIFLMIIVFFSEVWLFWFLPYSSV